MTPLGYEHLRQHLGLTAVEPARPALLKPVTRIVREATHLAIPRQVAPASDDPLAHLLFALKHEGTNLQVLAQALRHIEPAALVDELRKAPNGTYIRIACYLWEAFHEAELSDLPPIGGPTAEVFDPGRYITGPSVRVPQALFDFLEAAAAEALLSVPPPAPSSTAPRAPSRRPAP